MNIDKKIVDHPNLDEPEYLPVGKAAMQARCPRCRTGYLFSGKTYGIKTQKMHEKCEHCNLRFEREPGYFYVAMFVSYAFSVAQMVIVSLLVYLLTGIDDSFWLYLVVVLSVVVLLAPFNYRYSRVVQLYWLSPGLKFTPEYARARKASRPSTNPIESK